MTARDIELATIRTWPAAVTEERNGWFYLAAGGVTGRVNAVWPLCWRGEDADAAIADAEAWYAARKLPPRFKLTEGAVAPAHLASLLAARGYEATMPTLIMSATLASSARGDGAVALSETMPAAFDAVIRETAKDEAEYEERLGIALRAPQPAAFATLRHEGRVAAIGLAAAAGDLAGVFLMRTAPCARRQGLARRVLRALLARAASWDARTAFLQVEEDNAAAVALYASEGFARVGAYRFWKKQA